MPLDSFKSMSGDEIQWESAVESIRRRPEMYIGKLDRPDIGNCFVMEGLCLGFDAIVSGRCTQVHVRLGAVHVQVVDNSRGIPMARAPEGQFYAEMLMTELFCCQRMKTSEVIGKGVCNHSIAVMNALSSTCRFDNFTEGRHWRQCYTRGVPDADFQDLGETSKSGIELLFVPDTALIPNLAFDIPALLDLLASLEFTSGQATITIIDEPEGRSFVGRLREGKIRFAPAE